jgi:hypothetical protein
MSCESRARTRAVTGVKLWDEGRVDSRELFQPLVNGCCMGRPGILPEAKPRSINSGLPAMLLGQRRSAGHGEAGFPPRFGLLGLGAAQNE